MRVLLFFIFISCLGYGQSKITNTSFLGKGKSSQIDSSANFIKGSQLLSDLQSNTYTQKFNTFITSVNKNLTYKKPDFYKAYFKSNNISNKKQVVLKSFAPQFNSATFSIPLKYKYKNGSTCFYLLKSCNN